MFLMTFRHMGSDGRRAGIMFTRMSGDLLLPKVQADQCVAGMQLQILTHILMRNGVVMLLMLDVVVDIDLTVLIST